MPTQNTHVRKIPMTDNVYAVLSGLHKYLHKLMKDSVRRGGIISSLQYWK